MDVDRIVVAALFTEFYLQNCTQFVLIDELSSSLHWLQAQDSRTPPSETRAEFCQIQAASFFFGVRKLLGTIFSGFSTVYFSG